MKNIYLSILTLLLTAACNIAAAQNTYTNLIDGKTLNGWKTVGETQNFKLIHGIIVDSMKMGMFNNYLISDKQYGDFVLEMDVKITGYLVYSGVVIHGHLDTSLHKVDGPVVGQMCEIQPKYELPYKTDRVEHRWSGGIVEVNRRGWIYPMDLNKKGQQAVSPEVYNHVKIECIGSETKTWINGKAAADVVDTLNERGFIGLCAEGWISTQHSNNVVSFKNIKIRTANITPTPFPKNVYVRNMVPNNLTTVEAQNGWQLLFDGKSPAGWRSPTKQAFPEKGWKIENGMMIVDPQKKDVPSGGDIITNEKYSTFDLSFEFKTTPVANSGVKYFAYVDDKFGTLGLEYQVLDDALHPDAKLGRDGNRKEGSLYDLIPAKKDSTLDKPIGEWNTGRIIVYPNNHVEHYLNGVKVLEYDRLSPEFKKLIAISKYAHYPDFGIMPSGYILLQDHGCVVSYRNIKIRVLK